MAELEKARARWSQEWADLLVEGELSEEARREFLNQLDTMPDGWRRLALAFLEAQAWRQSLGELALSARSGEGGAEDAQKLPSAAADKPPRLARPNRYTRTTFSWPVPRRLWEVAALAAVFAVALAMGWIGRGIAPKDSQPVVSRGELASNPAPLPAPVATADAAGSTQARDLTVSPWRLVAVPVGVGPDGTMTMVDLPVLDSNPSKASAGASPGPYLPLPQVVESLRRSGHAVEHQREYVPVDLPDGTRSVFPVDNVQIQFVGNRAYQ